jgi:hypothetical protein
MAGSTKLMGFSPRPVGVGGVLNLERWGEKETVEISADSLGRIRDACQRLPARPPQESKNGSGSFNVQCDEGRIRVDMAPANAEALASVLAESADPSNAEHETWAWIHSLRAAIQDYRDSIEREPGVNDTH